MIERLGFAGGSVLEPSAGIVTFRLMPAALSAKSNLAGVEIDEISRTHPAGTLSGCNRKG